MLKGKQVMERLREDVRRMAQKAGIAARHVKTSRGHAAPALEFRTKGIRIWPKLIARSLKFQVDQSLVEAEFYSKRVWGDDAIPAVFVKREDPEGWVVAMRPDDFFRMAKLADTAAQAAKAEAE